MMRALIAILVLARTLTPLLSSGVDDHRIRVQAGKVVQILPVGRSPSMMKMVRHPDGSIYLNTQSTDSSRSLVRSRDDGRTWTILPIRFSPEIPEGQHAAGFGISSDGKLWLIHQGNPRSQGGEEVRYRDRQIFVATSNDGGESWKSVPFDFRHLSPGGDQDPYTVGQVAWCYPNFIARPGGAMAFSMSMRYPDWDDWMQQDQSRPGVRDVMVRSLDGGKTWADATVVHQHATETDYAVDPADPKRILALSRKQRQVLPGEDPHEVARLTGAPAPGESGGLYPYKGSVLLESGDGGRTFRELPDSYTGFYAHRGTIYWSPDNVVVVSHNTGYYHNLVPPTARRCTRISLDGGRTWVDGSRAGTPYLNQSTRFTDIIAYNTIAVGKDRFFSAYAIMAEPAGNRRLGSSEGFFWSLTRGTR